MGENFQHVKHGLVRTPYISPHLRGRAQEMQEKPSDIPSVLPHLRGFNPTHKRTIGFLDLAAEVRNKIYRYALTARRNDPQRCVWSRLDPYRFRSSCGPDKSSSGWATDEGQTYRFATGLLRVNRQVYHEASSIFYGENGFVLIRDPQDVFSHKALNPLLQRSIPAIAVTSKASECNRMTMIYQLGDRDIEPINYLEIQIVIAAKDLELFALILFEMSLCEMAPQNIMYSVQATENSYASSKAARQELLIGLRIFMGPKMALMDDLLWLELRQGPRSPKYCSPKYSYIDFQTLSERVEAKVTDGSFVWADFYFEELEMHWARRVRPTQFGWWGHCVLPVIKWKQRHAEALRKAGQDKKAYEVIKSAISMWQEQDVPKTTPDLQSEISCLRARLDESDGSLARMRDAVFWFKEALRYDPNNTALNGDIERVEKEVVVLDSSIL